MAKDTIITRDAYAWGHFAVILFHFVIGLILVLIYFNEKMGWSIETVRIICITFGVIMMVMSILALVPIFKWYDDTKKIIIDRK